jgi:hypothetical protein
MSTKKRGRSRVKATCPKCGEPLSLYELYWKQNYEKNKKMILESRRMLRVLNRDTKKHGVYL